MTDKKLEVVPITFAEANEFVKQHHRHHGTVTGTKFCIAISDGERIIGVAMVGRPVSRMLDDGWTLEVNRTCTTGERNVNSMLYGAAWRAGRALGYKKIVTYTLPSESGISLKASGWKCIGQTGGGSWNRASRPTVDRHPTQTKLRWDLSAIT